MNVREYLESIRALDLSIEAKLRQEEMLRTRLTDTAAHIGGDAPRSSSPNKDKVGIVMAAIVDLQAERNAEIDRFVDMKAAIKDAVKSLPVDEKAFIESYYFSHKSIPYITATLHICRRSAYNLRDRAISHLEKVCTNCTL